MKRDTETVITSILAADSTIKTEDAEAALSLLRGDRSGAEVDYPLTRAEAAKMLRVSRVTVTAWARRGVIRRFSIEGRKKAVGYSRRSVLAILSGEQTKGGGNE